MTDFTLQNAGLKHYYRGYAIERRQNSCNYSINGSMTTFITLAACKKWVDDLHESFKKTAPKKK